MSRDALLKTCKWAIPESQCVQDKMLERKIGDSGETLEDREVMVYQGSFLAARSVVKEFHLVKQ
jgi:hypothetical protein